MITDTQYNYLSIMITFVKGAKEKKGLVIKRFHITAFSMGGKFSKIIEGKDGR